MTEDQPRPVEVGPGMRVVINRGIAITTWRALYMAVAFTIFSVPNITRSEAHEVSIGTNSAVTNLLGAINTEFQKSSGHTLKITTDLGPNIVKRIGAGEKFDVVIIAPVQIDQLTKAGLLVSSTRTEIVRSGIGVEVRAGAPKPDISTVAAFKTTLLNAKSVGYLSGAASGDYVAGMLQRLGIADALKPKVQRPDTDIVSKLVAAGQIDLGMVVIPQIVTTKGVELVGPLPPELQSYIAFEGAVTSNATTPDAGKNLIEFLKGPKALTVIRAQGMEQG